MEGARGRFRRSPDRVLGGVAAGFAEHLRLPVTAVRLAFAALAFFQGFGLLLYLAYWAAVPLAERPEGARRRADGVAGYLILAGLAAVAAVGVVAAMPVPLLWPGLLAVAGLAIVWREADEARGRLPGIPGRVMLGAGAVLLLAGLSALGGAIGWQRPGSGLVAAPAALVVAAAAGWPWWRRLVTELVRERRARIRSQERAEVAAHLHDSVLQTLTLIQRQAASPREVQRLARRQERDLRDWLYGRTGDRPATLAGAVRAAADEVEDGYGVVVDLVVVGDAPMDERAAALVQAAREALVNAARHSGAETVSAYVEVEPERATVYVRDRGRGFDPAAQAPGRFGLAESVVGRMERYGGRATVQSAPGDGTEVELELPW